MQMVLPLLLQVFRSIEFNSCHQATQFSGHRTAPPSLFCSHVTGWKTTCKEAISFCTHFPFSFRYFPFVQHCHAQFNLAKM